MEKNCAASTVEGDDAASDEKLLTLHFFCNSPAQSLRSVSASFGRF